MKIISETNKAWLAGFVDGEGYVGIVRNRKKNGSLIYHPWIDVTSTNEKVILEVLSIVGVGKRALQRPTVVNKAAYHFKLTKHNDLVLFIESVKPYLRIKNRQADLIIQFCALRKKAKIVTGRGSNGKTSYGSDDENIYLKLRELNKRGT